MDWNDRRDEDFVSRGFIANRDDPQIRDDKGNIVFDSSFLDRADPATIHPSLLSRGATSYG